MPLALGAQVLLRGDLLFQPQVSLRTLVALLALPAAGAVATWILARRHGGGPALLAAGAVLVLAPGWNVAATLGLIALAAGDQLARPDLGRIGSAAAVLVLLAPIAWEPGPGLVTAVAGLALWRPRLALGLAVPLAAALFWAGSHGHGPAPALLDGVTLLILLLPSVALAAGSRPLWALAALILVSAAPRIPDALGPGGTARTGRSGRVLRRSERTRIGPAVVLQRVWTGVLPAAQRSSPPIPGCAPTPWSRRSLSPGWLPTRCWDGVARRRCSPRSLILATVLRALPEHPGSVRLAAGAAAGAIVLPRFLSIFLGGGAPLLPPETGVILDPVHPAWSATFAAPRRIGAVVVESSLSGGAALEDGTPVAQVRLSDDARAERPLDPAGGRGDRRVGGPAAGRGAHSPAAFAAGLDLLDLRKRGALFRLSATAPLEPGGAWSRFTHLRVRSPGICPLMWA